MVSLGGNTIPICIKAPIVGVVKPVGTAAGTVTLVVADSAESEPVKMGTAIEYGCIDGSTAEDGLELAGFKGTEADGVTRASCGNTYVDGNVEVAEGDVGAYSEDANFDVKVLTVFVGDISNSAATVNAMVIAWRIREYERDKWMKVGVKKSNSMRQMQSAQKN